LDRIRGVEVPPPIGPGTSVVVSGDDVPVTDTAILEAEVPAQRRRTPAKRKARKLAKQLRAERPDCTYLREVFRRLRVELDVPVATTTKKLPFVPSEDQLRSFYTEVWRGGRSGDIPAVPGDLLPDVARHRPGSYNVVIDKFPV
jgi:hypothetical protein